jgi:2-desacetyl-2-hydroxyethyl bacteriochlorophyllide A dehydrogenase
MPQTYRKLVFQDTHADLVEVALPELGENQMLMKARCSLISPGTERAALKRLWDDAEFRANPGYALAGEVAAVGQQVWDLAVGDRVIALAPHGSHAVLPADPWVVLKIPEGLSDEKATFVVLASVALHAIRRAQISLGETFVILGAGILGQIAVQLAKMDGARQVIVVDLAENRLALARRYGADLTVNPSEEDAVGRIFDATGGEGASLILEVTGNPQVIPTALKMAGNGGRIVLTGALEEPVTLRFHQEFIRRELSLIAAFQPFNPVTANLYWRWTQQANRQLLLELLAEGKLRVEEMLTHRFPASAGPQVYERIKAGEMDMLGVLLEWNQESANHR